MDTGRLYNAESGSPGQVSAAIQEDCARLKEIRARGELGAALAQIVLMYSPRDVRQMMENFGNMIRDISPEYSAELEAAVTGHLLGTYQNIRLMDQQGAFARMKEPVSNAERVYWDMAAEQCRAGAGDLRLRFLKFLLAGFCMIVWHEPGHPVGMRFPGGDRVELIDGVYYCPVREKANDVDAALCPYCPALQTPAVGYLKPPVNASEHRKQEFIDNCYRYHNFNG
jgi:uncharacterized protein (UPF0305 family)